MSPYERAVLISFAVGAICTLLWVAARLAYPRQIPDDEWSDDLRRIDQRYRDASE